MSNLSPTQSQLSQTIELHEEAKMAERLLDEGARFIFLTGRAGTGKSTFINHLRKKYTDKNFAVCAPTGIAALNARGSTIHSLFKIPAKVVDPTTTRPKLVDAVRGIDILLIDEISMARADIVDYVDISLRLNKKNNKPFGGIQVIFVGDCFQLPPVVTNAEKHVFSNIYLSPWWFDSMAVRMSPPLMIEFNTVYRQSDPEFIAILNAVREGVHVDVAIAEFNARCCVEVPDDSPHVALTARKVDARRINQYCLDKLQGEVFTYTGISSGKFSTEEDDNIPAPKILQLKIGAHVLVTKNMGPTIVNGTLAEIIKLKQKEVTCRAFSTGEEFVVTKAEWEQYKYDWDPQTKRLSSEKVGSYSQVPLTHGWAITIHKSQGLTLDYVQVDLGNGAFAAGQTYVALSRCTTLEGLRITRPLHPGDVIVDKRVVEFMKGFDG